MKYTDEEIDGIIEKQTRQWIKSNAIHPPHTTYRSVIPYMCEHCEQIMTITGKLPPVKDVASWFHWCGWTSDGEPIQKIKALWCNTRGRICMSCDQMWDEMPDPESDE